MNKTVRSVMVGLVAIGVAEIVFRGADAAFYAWYLLFVLWIVRLFTGFVLAAVDAYKAAFAKGLDLTMAFPEFEQKKHRLVEVAVGKKVERAARLLPVPGANSALKASSRITESIRSCEKVIRSGSFSTFEVVPYGYRSEEPEVRAR